MAAVHRGQQLPLVYFHGLVPGRYLATWPVFLVQDRPELLEDQPSVLLLESRYERFLEVATAP